MKGGILSPENRGRKPMAGGAGGDGLGWVETGSTVQLYHHKGGW